MHQRGMGFETQIERRNTREHAVLVAWQFTQHDGHGGLVKVLHVVGRNAYANGAGPVGDSGQFTTQVVQYFLRGAGVVVGHVQQGQGRRPGVALQGHLGAQLRQHQPRRHDPLRMGCVAVGEQFH